VICKKLVISLK